MKSKQGNAGDVSLSIRKGHLNGRPVVVVVRGRVTFALAPTQAQAFARKLERAAEEARISQERQDEDLAQTPADLRSLDDSTPAC